jgi:two-component system response regulator HydG
LHLFRSMPWALDDVQVLELLDLDPQAGTIRLYDQRMVLQGAAAMGLLRRELVDTLGAETARRLLLRFGYADGYHDAVTLRDRFCWANPIDGVRAGLRLHSLEGIVQAEAQHLAHDPAAGTFEARVTWHNSYEAEQHLYHFGPSADPVCWTLVGYISGFASACTSADVYFRESACAGCGESRCVLVGQHALGWGAELPALHDAFHGADLRAEVERLRAIVKGETRNLRRRQGAPKRGNLDTDTVRERAMRHARRRHFVARSPGMYDALEMALRVAPLDSTVIITGESGTGKEFFARMIHDESARAHGAWVPVNCGALAETLLESELFGHVRGAFTGASFDKTGLFEQAARGTLFLDEIGEMPPALQVKLLRALQEREIRRVGGERTIRIDVRVLAATNRDLRADVKAGRFREDLYFRLGGLEIRVPPLRERREEIPLLVTEFLRQASARCRKRITSVSPEAMSRLLNYPWPGNVRELEHAIERAVILARRSTVTTRDLPSEIREAVESLPATELNLKRHEQRLIHQAIVQFGGNRKRAAESLGISTVSLWRKLRDRPIRRSR